MNSIQSVSKAIGGAVVTAVVAYAARHNVVVNADTSAAIVTVVSAVIGFVVVYISPKNKV